MKNIIRLLLAVNVFTIAASAQSNVLPYADLSAQRAAVLNKKPVKATRLLDSVQIIRDLTFLASDICEGRRPGTKGHQHAVERILSGMRKIGLDSFDNSLIKTFTGRAVNQTTEGKNIVGWLKGKKEPKKFMVISAHYDHMGKNKQGATFYGADDNASGVACMLALAKYFKKNPPPYSIIFAAFDREETGLEGGMKFVEQLEESNRLATVKFNLNLDMVARSDSNELFVCGVKHYPNYKFVVEQVKPKTNARLLMGHDYGSLREDWTRLSDQYAFHKKGIPFLFVSVEDHADYHKPTDTVSRIDLSKFIENCNAILLMAKAIKIP